MNNRDKIKYMDLALELAEKAKDRTYPNPMVGAVLVKAGKIVGRGYHRKAGEDHAEVAAIKDAGRACRGATMFVTLEPCDHYGKTPPCTGAIIESGIRTVYAAMKDPNPLNSGRGAKRLEKAGISVRVGLLEEKARFLNRKYIKFVTKGLPYVTVKLAQSMDGKIAARDGSSKWISSAVSREFVKKMRAGYDAILVGSGTVVKDDPFLLDEKRKGYDVSRVVVDTRLRTPFRSNIIRTAGKSPVIIGTTALAPAERIKKFKKVKGVRVLKAQSKNNRVSMRSLLSMLAREGIVNMFVEGGGELVGSLIDDGLVDEVMFFISPKIIGGEYSSIKGKGIPNIAKALDLRDVEVKRSGEDIFVKGRVTKDKG
jgi:diaminohydroxyphosphoribosylaminopyrimidine deaminase/5-amino-6-(5-phosphoribosylamino)uracil reductase